MTNPRELEMERAARLRGWIIRLIYEKRPDPVELLSLTSMLDKRNFPLSRRGLSNELDYLRTIGYLRVFPAGADEEQSRVQQARLLQRYANTISDDELGCVLCARLTAAGIDFQQGLVDNEAIERR